MSEIGHRLSTVVFCLLDAIRGIGRNVHIYNVNQPIRYSWETALNVAVYSDVMWDWKGIKKKTIDDNFTEAYMKRIMISPSEF
jgi:hypothetical protein